MDSAHFVYHFLRLPYMLVDVSYVLIVIERYMAICHPSAHQQLTKKWTVIQHQSSGDHLIGCGQLPSAHVLPPLRRWFDHLILYLPVSLRLEFLLTVMHESPAVLSGRLPHLRHLFPAPVRRIES